jgi:hypothetical protein
VSRHQQLAARIDVKGPAVNAVRVDVLDRDRFAARRVNLVNGKSVLAAREDGFAVDLRRRGGAIDDINKTAARMHVNSAGNLPPADVLRLGQGLLPIDGLGR